MHRPSIADMAKALSKPQSSLMAEAAAQPGDTKVGAGPAPTPPGVTPAPDAGKGSTSPVLGVPYDDDLTHPDHPLNRTKGLSKAEIDAQAARARESAKGPGPTRVVVSPTPKNTASPKGGVTQSSTTQAGTTRAAADQETTVKKKTTTAKAKGKGKTAKTKAPKTKTPKTPKVKAERAPSKTVAEILRLSSRDKGVTPDELNKFTGWKGAPWKWLFQNPKKNGYCDRWGYSFQVIKDDEGTHYKTIKKADKAA